MEEIINAAKIGKGSEIFIPKLKDGYNYSITIKGQDRAGNFATPTQLNDVKIDLTPPRFSSFYPSTGAFINKLDFGWDLSEDINSGSLTFISNDTLIIELSDGEKNFGKREIETLINMILKKAEILELPQETLGSKKDLIDLISKNGGRLSSGWRNNIIGKELTKIIQS